MSNSDLVKRELKRRGVIVYDMYPHGYSVHDTIAGIQFEADRTFLIQYLDELEQVHKWEANAVPN